MTSTVGVIGDVHGELEKVRSLVETASRSVDELVFLGDYVNRGEDSAGVIEYLVSLSESGVPCTFLAGNHDQAFHDAIVGDGFDLFLQIGGAATVRSYLRTIEPDVEAQLRREVPARHVEFLAALRTTYESHGLFASHDRVGQPIGQPVRFHVFGHAPQRALRPLISSTFAAIDTGCGTWPGAPLTCFHWPSRDWTQAM